MRAAILAAGIGDRLKPFTEQHPKCLLVIDGKTLLHRHIEALQDAGVKDITLVTGHLAEQIVAEVEQFKGQVNIDLVFNEQYKRGSILSLFHALDSKVDDPDDTIIMDADVLYHHEVLGRLVRSVNPNSFLMDESSKETGEEMMLGARDGRVWTIARRVGSDWDNMGEGVGFFKVCRQDVLALLAVVKAFVEAGRISDEYEAALNTFIQEFPAGFVPVGDLPWTEIDFPQDVVKAQNVILPLIRKINGAKTT